MSEQIKDTTQTAYIPQATVSEYEQIGKNGFFAFLMALGVLPSESQRSMYEALELQADVSKLNAENLISGLEDASTGITDDNFTEKHAEILDYQQAITKEQRNQDLVMSIRMPDLANVVKGSLTMAYSFVNSMYRVIGAPGRRIY